MPDKAFHDIRSFSEKFRYSLFLVGVEAAYQKWLEREARNDNLQARRHWVYEVVNPEIHRRFRREHGLPDNYGETPAMKRISQSWRVLGA